MYSSSGRRAVHSSSFGASTGSWRRPGVDPAGQPHGTDNEFNLAIADRRIRRTWQKALYLLDFARHISNIRDLVVWFGSDLINGAIHEELEESNFLGPAEAVLYAQDHVAAGLDLLLREAKVDSITVLTSYGNHGRTTKKRRISTGYRHSWEWLRTTIWPATTARRPRDPASPMARTRAKPQSLPPRPPTSRRGRGVAAGWPFMGGVPIPGRHDGPRATARCRFSKTVWPA